jgi:hypothetical protein
MLGGADNPNGELPSYITGANSYGHRVYISHVRGVPIPES